MLGSWIELLVAFVTAPNASLRFLVTRSTTFVNLGTSVFARSSSIPVEAFALCIAVTIAITTAVTAVAFTHFTEWLRIEASNKVASLAFGTGARDAVLIEFSALNSTVSASPTLVALALPSFSVALMTIAVIGAELVTNTAPRTNKIHWRGTGYTLVGCAFTASFCVGLTIY